MTKGEYLHYFFKDFPRLPGFYMKLEGDKVITFRPGHGEELWWPERCLDHPNCKYPNCLGWVMVRTGRAHRREDAS